MRAPLAGHQEDGFQFGSEGAVGERHGEFPLDVAEGPQAPQHDPRPAPPHKIDRQPFKAGDIDIGEFTGGAGDEVEPLLRGEQRGLFGIDANPHGQPIEQGRPAPDDVVMPQREGVEAAGVDGMPPIARSHGTACL